MNTPMNLIYPTVSSTPGPTWASELNEDFQIVENHDHTDGHGVPITPAGMDINDDLDFQQNDIQNAGAVGFFALISAILSKLGTLQRIGGDLHWINSAGADVQITNGSSLASVGSGVLTTAIPPSYPYNVLITDAQKILIIDSTSARTANLPAASNAMLVGFKDGGNLASTNNITLVPNGTDTIDGANANYLIQEDGGMRFFISDGISKWYVI